jgi:CRP-like cAMP-binding protein
MAATNGNGPHGVDPEFVTNYRAGDFVFREGEAGAEMYIIQAGEVEILKLAHDDLHRLALLEEGDFFGEMAILEELPRTAAARAHTDCALLKIDHSTFDQLIRHNPEISIRMLRKLCHRLRMTNPALLEADAVPSSEGPEESIGTGVPVGSTKPRAFHPRLVHASSKTEFLLAAQGESTVGRFDSVTGLSPTVDLREVDVERSCSRRHARIIVRKERVLVREEVGTANGTFVNGERLASGIEVAVEDGDTVRFGAVETVFRCN